MRSTDTSTWLRPADAAVLYLELVVIWELKLKQSGKFRFESKRFQAFCSHSGSTLRAFGKSKELDAAIRKDQLFKNRPGNQVYFLRGNNKAQNLIRSIRNAAAHGGIYQSKLGSVYYVIFEGVYRGKTNLNGQIERSLFAEFVRALMSTARNA